ncbi:T9SS type A sorting domain-containing protein [Marinoscillum furvescens]|nr:T9SS type A sorting domain-containing protein [Marinoscillum furvescens]
MDQLEQELVYLFDDDSKSYDLSYRYYYTYDDSGNQSSREQQNVSYSEFFDMDMFRTYHYTSSGSGYDRRTSRYENVEGNVLYKWQSDYDYDRGSYTRETDRLNRYTTTNYSEGTIVEVYSRVDDFDCTDVFRCGSDYTNYTNTKTTSTYSDNTMSDLILRLVAYGDENNENWRDSIQTTYTRSADTLTTVITRWTGVEWLNDAKTTSATSEGKQTLNESYNWNSDELIWVGVSKWTREYDASGNLTDYITYSWDDTHSTWVAANSQRTVNTYNDVDSLVVKEKFEWNEVDMEWSPLEKYVYDYDEWSNETLNERYTWNGSAYDQQSGNKFTYAYDANDNMTLYERQTFNSSSDAYIPFDKKVYQYDSVSQQLLYERYSWDTDASDWYVKNRTKSAYDESGNLILHETYFYHSGLGKLYGSEKWEKVFDGDFQTLELNYTWDSSTDSWSGSDGYQRSLTTNEQKLNTSFEYYTYNSSIQDFVGSQKYEATYNSEGKVLTKTSYGWDTGTESWYVNKTENYEYYDGIRHTLQEIYSRASIGEELSGLSKVVNLYDELGNNTETINYVWDDIIGDWANTGTRSSQEFNEYNVQIRYKAEVWNESEMKWDTTQIRKYDYTYLEDTSLYTERIYSTLDLSTKQFDPIQRNVKAYDRFYKDTLILNYTWSTDVWALQSGNKYKFNYDSYGNQTEYEKYYYHSGTESFIGQEKWEKLFDSNGTKLRHYVYRWDNAGKEWILDYGSETYYDDDEDGVINREDVAVNDPNAWHDLDGVDDHYDQCEGTVIPEFEITEANYQSYDFTEVSQTLCGEETFDFGGQVIAEAGNYYEYFVSSTGCDSVVVLSIQKGIIYDETIEVTRCASDVPYAFGSLALSESGNYTQTLSSSYGCDSTVNLTFTLLPEPQQTIEQVLCHGESFDFDGQSLSTTGVYEKIYTSQTGCDSLVTVNLTVNEAVIATQDPITSCGSVSINGTTYNESQTITDLFPGGAANGCDSTSITELTILSPVVATQPAITGCESVTYKGVTYNSSQTVEEVFAGQASNGCDSTSITEIIVLEPVVTTQNPVTACGSVSINGTTYYESQTVTDLFPGGAENGCDSTSITELTILAPVVATQPAITGCESVTYKGLTYNSSQTVEEVFAGQASNGCDSTSITEIIVLEPVVSTQDPVTACGSASINGTTYYESQTVTDLFPGGAANGCDSTSITELTILAPVIAKQPAISGCESVTYKGVTYNSSQTVEEVFAGQASNGCDSTSITEIIVLEPVVSTQDPVIACGSISINGTTYYESQTVTDVFAGGAANGCDSTSITEVVIINATPETTQTDNQISTETLADTYQWIDCASDQEIEGEISATFVPLVSGSYAVRTILDNCSFISDCIDFKVENADVLNAKKQIRISPNPTNDFVEINLLQSANITIVDMNGRVVISSHSNDSKLIKLDLSELSEGIYLLNILSESKSQTHKIIKR